MSSHVRIRRALISVSDKTDLVPFARSLADCGVEIVSTGGTARALGAAGVDVIPIEQVTGFPEMMDGRVKTLHPSVHGALLGRRDVPAHMDAMAAHDITPIDLVCINLYPFERTIRAEGVTDAEAIEQIDIGGPAMLRSASKNHAAVTVVTSTNQYDRVIAEMRANDGATTLQTRRDLAAAAFMRTAEYDTAISAWMCARRPEPFPPLLRLVYAHHGELRYGENPHQAAAAYTDPSGGESGVIGADLLHGKPLSYNNLADAAAALELVRDLAGSDSARAAAAVIKHTNPCGAALAEDGRTAFEAAYAGDPLAAYGGILAMSTPVDEAIAAAITDGGRFLEVVVAPEFAPGAVEALGARWKNVRLLRVAGFAHRGRGAIDYRSVPGGMLVQQRDDLMADPRGWELAAGPAPSEAALADAAVAWIAAKHLKSNAIAIAGDGRLRGAGAGQMDRVTACRLAIEKAQAGAAAAAGLVAASDAFFPFKDGPELLIDAGVTTIVHPGGSKRDQETFDLCAERGVSCLITGVRHFRH